MAGEAAGEAIASARNSPFGRAVREFIKDESGSFDLGKLLGRSEAATRKTLYHYTDEAGLKGITESKSLWASTKAANPGDVKFGNGQYLSDVVPGTKDAYQL